MLQHIKNLEWDLKLDFVTTSPHLASFFTGCLSYVLSNCEEIEDEVNVCKSCEHHIIKGKISE